MPIQVTCSSCKTSFKVSERFAGREGPCPKCKSPIRIPTEEEAAAAAKLEVKIHEPEAYGPQKDAKGRAVLKPIEREETRFNPLWAGAVLGGALLLLGVAWYFGKSMTNSDGEPLPVLYGFVGLLIVALSGPVAIAGYWILRDSEREAYSGMSLYVRTGVAAAIYCSLWVVLWYIKSDASPWPGLLDEGWNWLFVAPPLVALGTVVSYFAYDLEGTESFLHFALFVLVSAALRWAAGLPPV